MTDINAIAELTPDNTTPLQSIRPTAQAEQKPGSPPSGKPEKPKLNRIVEPLHQHEVLRSGDPERAVKLDEKTTKLAIDRLVKARLYASQIETGDTKGSNLPDKGLSLIDRLVLDDDLAGRLARRELSGKDLFLANRVVLNELILTQIAIARLVRQNPSQFQGLRDAPLVGRLVGVGGTNLENLGIPAEYLDRFIEFSGIRTWDTNAAENQLRDLNGIYMRIEASLYRNGIRDPIVDSLRDHLPFFGRRYHDPIFDERNGLIYLPRLTAPFVPPPADRPGQIASITRERGEIPHDEFVRQVRTAIEARIAKGELAPGTTFEQVLLGANPVEAFRILYEANQTAAAQESTEAWKRILSKEAVTTDAKAIAAQTERLKKPPTDEDIRKLDDEVFALEGERIALENTESDRAADETAAQEKYTNLSGRLTIETTNFPPLEAKFREEDTAFTRNRPRLQVEMSRDSRRYNTLLTRQEGIRRSAMRIRDQQQRQNALVRAEGMRSEIENALTALNRSSDLLKAARDKVARARGLRDAQRALITTLTGDVATAKTDLNTATTAHRDATEAKRLKEREKALKEAEKNGIEGKKNAKTHIGEMDEIDGETRWTDVASGRPRVYETEFSQREGDPFTNPNLTSTEVTRENQVMGAERIRELIIQTANKLGWNPELARKMLSDETIARAVLIYFGIDFATAVTVPPTPGAAGVAPTTFNNLLEEIQTRRDALEFLPSNQTQRRAALEQEIRQAEINTTRATLSYISGEHRSKISSLINFVINEGIRSAEKGQPFLSFVR